MNREFLGELISEALAVFIIIAFGDSVAAMYLLYDPSPYLHAYWGVCIVWGLGVTVAIYATGSVSGTHANPAVTLALATYRAFPWKKVIPYWVAQIVGGFLGAALVYALYYPVINHFNDLHQMTRVGGGGMGVFFTSPAPGITVWHAFSDEIILTAILVFGIFAITEQYNEMAPGANFGALIIGFLVAAIGASMGYLEAWAINPARDLGPRLFAYIAGWHGSALPAMGHYWWVPIAGPLIGGVLGATAYEYLIYPFLPAQLRAQKARQGKIGEEGVIIVE
ncbi:aquaporin family protein [Gluconacetobacter entanii]|uniref:Aquaporin family protein n=1 Tax=Gluconacetobacter entanii TaxID=108528 RepID=A0ABT3KA76_9PROT|nr:MIP/aquaporin family protein [Gluconacetobacter entanii]MCW4592334.1 aquaporin family protein [Gluconacetobacter entanii]MCW4595656.1 aquaporin family protein [Gluconacetobacter entanii]NPC87547.1 aquaporin family protein [Gluconacetobacter entanii]